MVYTSDLNGQNYWSMVMLPDVNNNLIELSEEYSQYAYVFPSKIHTLNGIIMNQILFYLLNLL